MDSCCHLHQQRWHVDTGRPINGNRDILSNDRGVVIGKSLTRRRHAAGATFSVQNAHLPAAIGMLLRHSGHPRVVGSAGTSAFLRAISAFTGFTTKKNTAAAIDTKAISVLMKAPYLKVLL